MSTSEIIGIIFGFITLTGSLIGIYIGMKTKLELMNNDNEHLRSEVTSLQKRVGKVEDEVYDHITDVKDKLHEILLKINKLEK